MGAHRKLPDTPAREAARARDRARKAKAYAEDPRRLIDRTLAWKRENPETNRAMKNDWQRENAAELQRRASARYRASPAYKLRTLIHSQLNYLMRHDQDYYACGCGHTFEHALGKYGCPNCGGDEGPARLFVSPN